jgi:hypothetical protein
MDLPAIFGYATHRATPTADTFDLAGVLADIHFHRQHSCGLASYFRKLLFGYGPNGI